MLNGIFGKWLREFATLVLTQTVQAFLLAIVMTVIISCLGNSGGSAEGNQAAGLLAIIALASFGKIEMLVKNIFGVTSQFGDPSLSEGSKGLTAGGLLALKGGKRLLDNGSKMVDSHRKIAEAKRGLAAIGDGNETGGASLGNKTGTNSNIDNGTDGINNNIQGATDLAETSLKVQGLENVSSLNTAINNLESTIKSSNVGNKKEKYEAMLKEGKDMRRSAVRENIGAAIGGMSGAIVGLAKGDDIIKTTLAGAGAGDALGAASASRRAKKIDYNKNMNDLQQKIEKLSVEQYDANIKSMEESLKKQGMGGKGLAERVKVKGSYAINNSIIGDIANANRNSEKNTRARLKNKGE